MIDTKKSAVIDPRKADAQYKPFPSFLEWRTNSYIDLIRWDRYSKRLNEIKESAGSDVKRVREAIELAAAIDTGAIEGLYDTDRGFTYTVAFESAIWQSAVSEAKGEKVRALIESQLEAFEYVLDFATENVPIASAWIRELHSQVCKEQETYQAITEIGIQNLPLRGGQFKSLPNHVHKQSGEIHSYAPVDLVSAEMLRLCDELNSMDFQESHPVLQSAYSHYAFVAIHPFADGNGRVARALASVYTYRSHSIPLLIFADSREKYRFALEQADEGNYQAFMDFILDVGLSSIQLFADSLQTNGSAVGESIAKIQDLYVTKGGYSHEEVDKAGYELTELFHAEFDQHLSSISLPSNITPQVSIYSATIDKNSMPESYRQPLGGGRNISLLVSTTPPAKASASVRLSLAVPTDCGRADDIILMIDKDGVGETFDARASELIPTQTAALQMRVKLTVRRIIDHTLRQLAEEAKIKF